ncbi:MAG: PfaD family polyunsaturated fatty acid/polyketide biosynthesis protein [Desulfobacterales bacterium]|jgi:trans-AT polyketide synthase/acyltransferase/oxidoreductase domain-containing protein|nr:PfaD family polyunsaturated fatty acid/polyketide biosynthesis protein [Desulfobacterales bacterium]
MESKKRQHTVGWWLPENIDAEPGEQAIRSAILKVNRPVYLLDFSGLPAVAQSGKIIIGNAISPNSAAVPLCAYAPPLNPEHLGDPLFRNRHRLRYAYIVGAMANGITSVKMVETAGRSGCVGFFGAAGLSLDQIDSAIDRLKQSLESIPYGFNLIHIPNDPELEEAVVRLYLQKEIKLVSASAYLNLTLPLVYYRVKGIHRDASGRIVCPNKVIAKASRVEVAQKYFSPPPLKLLNQLLDKNMITREEAQLAESIPMADDLTAEADSGGHTDNRPAISLLPTMIALRDELAGKYRYKNPPSVGLGGGIATPHSAAAAFAMGAAYILTGSVNQSCVEAGTSEAVRQMLAEAGQADVTMAPAADMFEMGVKVQVLKRGTMFPLRAAKLYDLYCSYDRFESLPEKQRLSLERDFFRKSFQEEWEQTKIYFTRHDPRQIERAEKNPKHKMALVFRSYLGQSSNWANSGDLSRKIDYQIWCGPAMGAFNQWVQSSFLERPENRLTVTVAMNLLYGAAVMTRINWLKHQGAVLPAGTNHFPPMPVEKIQELQDS